MRKLLDFLLSPCCGSLQKSDDLIPLGSNIRLYAIDFAIAHSESACGIMFAVLNHLKSLRLTVR